MEQFKDQTRLPKFAVPKRYDLNLKPDLSVCTFSGSVHIDLSILQATKVIVLNALELVIDEVYFTNSVAQQFYPSGVVLNADDEMLILVFDETLTVGDGVLAINFSGILNEHMKGFYRGTYVDGGVNKNMAVTQFEAVDARRCFPCWDEPALKATFKITVNVPSELTALSNMPVVNEKFNGNIKTVYFEESPIMSTYLVAVVVGLFDQIEETTADGIKVSAYCPVGKSEKGKLALDIAVKSLNLYTKYFSMPYTLPKLDMVAIPDFSAGAMENYGLITFRESELLYDDKNSAAANKQRLAIVVTHEVAHQWFGNLVTMEWWTDLWLNEGFATWISYLATESLFPEWKIWSQFVVEFNGGLRMDALEQSHPIEVEIRHARSVDELFDAISYQKGFAVIRMLQDYIGDYIFQKSLGSYMKTYACKNAKTEDLWRVIAEESGVPVDKMMGTWTKQKGYPVISIKSKDHILEFEQSQFLSSGLNGDVQWIVPMTISVGPYKRRKNFLLETKMGSINISELFKSPDGKSNSVEKSNEETSGEDIWIKLNFEQAGFYRVKYEESLASQLRKAIENNQLSETDKFGILDDTFALCEACELPLSSLLTLLNVYRKEIDYIVLSKIIEVCYSVAAISIEAIPNLLKDLKQFFISILLFSAEKLGWEPVPGESHSSRMSREQVLMALAIFGHIGTHEEAMKRFETFLNDRNTPLLSADTRRPAYIAIMREASSTNRNGFESLLNVYREADSVHEKSRILRCLSTSSDPNIVLETLNLLFTDEVRDQDVVYVLGWISSEGREIAWTWLKENWDLILSKWGGGLLTRFVKNIVSLLCSYEKADEVEAFFERRMNLSIVMSVKQSIEQVRIKARWAQNIQHDLSLEEIVRGLACQGC